MKAVRTGGTVRVYGVLSGDTTTIQTIDMRSGDKALRGFIMPQWIAKQVNILNQDRVILLWLAKQHAGGGQSTAGVYRAAMNRTAVKA